MGTDSRYGTVQLLVHVHHDVPQYKYSYMMYMYVAHGRSLQPGGTSGKVVQIIMARLGEYMQQARQKCDGTLHAVGIELSTVTNRREAWHWNVTGSRGHGLIRVSHSWCWQFSKLNWGSLTLTSEVAVCCCWWMSPMEKAEVMSHQVD